jgi:hypothetical protein
MVYGFMLEKFSLFLTPKFSINRASQTERVLNFAYKTFCVFSLHLIENYEPRPNSQYNLFRHSNWHYFFWIKLLFFASHSYILMLEIIR